LSINIEVPCKLEVPCKIANEAIFNHDLRATLQKKKDEAEDTESYDESEADDDNDEHEIQSEDGENERTIGNDIDTKINNVL
jgi:hypothetical protein